MTELPKGTSLSIPGAAQSDGDFGNSALSTIGPRDILRFLRQSKLLIGALSAAGIVVAMLYTAATAPTFRAVASVIFDPNINGAMFKDEQGQANEISSRIDSQVEVIKSRRVTTAVVEKLGLQKDREFSTRGRSLLPPWGSTQASTNLESAVVALTNRIGVRRVGQSTALEITVASGSAEKSALVANAVAQAYIDVALQDRSSAAKNGATWLESRLDHLRQQAFNALMDSEKFKSVGDAGSGVDSRVKLAELESIAQSYRKMYDTFLLKYFETEQLVSYPVADAHILSPASAGLADKSPKKGAVVAFAGIAGAFLGIGVSLLLQAMNNTTRSIESIAPTRRVTFCGVVEHQGTLTPNKRQANFLQRWGVPARLAELAMTRSRREDLRLSSLIDNPAPSLQNGIRRIRSTVLATLVPGSAARFVGITSINSGEGKTAIAANLVRLCASSGYRTLLIDACSENPSATRLYSNLGAPGLLDALRSGEPLRTHIVKSESTPFAFLPCGNSVAGQSLSDLLDGQTSRTAFEALRTEYDVLVIDLHATTQTPDAMALAGMLDGMLLISQYGRTPLDSYQNELARLTSARFLWLGAVLNKVDPEALTSI